MNTNEKMRNLDEDYIIAFRNILKEAERMEREAMDRFHSWSNYLLHNIITENCKTKWRTLHLQNGENCRGFC